MTDSSPDLDAITTRSEEMQQALDLARAASATTASVLIQGESGTGKDVIAEAIHAASNRREQPCLTMNCSAIPTNLLESELFGHDKGAFQGAERMHRGKFELADGGTLILDEIGVLPANIQARVLRALEYGEFDRVGGEETLRCDVRVIATTTKDLTRLVADEAFRHDLYYRINEISILLPPLHSRREDLEMLIDGFIADCNEKFGKKVVGISQIALDYLLRYDFPGNVRELKSMIKRAVTVAKGELLWLEDLGMRVEVPSEQETTEGDMECLSLSSVERRHIQHVLHLTGGNKKRSAEYLKISRPTLDRKIKSYDLTVP